MDAATLMIPITGILASFAGAVLIVYFTSRSRQRRLELQAEMQAKLIDRFGSAPDLIQFLQSEPGRQFVSGVQSGPSVLARDRIVGGFRRAIILTALGVGFAVLAFTVDHDFTIAAVLAISLGVGYLLAGFLSLKMSSHPQPEGELTRL